MTGPRRPARVEVESGCFGCSCLHTLLAKLCGDEQRSHTPSTSGRPEAGEAQASSSAHAAPQQAAVRSEPEEGAALLPKERSNTQQRRQPVDDGSGPGSMSGAAAVQGLPLAVAPTGGSTASAQAAAAGPLGLGTPAQQDSTAAAATSGRLSVSGKLKQSHRRTHSGSDVVRTASRTSLHRARHSKRPSLTPSDGLGGKADAAGGKSFSKGSHLAGKGEDQQQRDEDEEEEEDEEEDFCATCLDPYNHDNPKVFTSCGHHFHLPCLYAWAERKDTCPMCETPLSFGGM